VKKKGKEMEFGKISRKSGWMLEGKVYDGHRLDWYANERERRRFKRIRPAKEKRPEKEKAEGATRGDVRQKNLQEKKLVGAIHHADQ